jgi:hypothetical protein
LNIGYQIKDKRYNQNISYKMVGKVIHNGEEYVVKNQYSDLQLKPDGPKKTQLIDMVEKQGFAFVDFEVETIAEGTSEFDVMDIDVAVILKVYNEDFGTPKELVSVATERYEKNKYPIGGFAPGNYWHKECITCKHEFIGAKRAVQCETCAIEMVRTKIVKSEEGGFEIDRDYLQGFIDQFGDGPLGELIPDEWTALDFLEWLKLNNYKITK